MTKIIIKFLLFFLITLIAGVFYLSYFGIKTDKFNSLIKGQILDKNKKIEVNLKDIKILLNLKDISINVKTINPEIIYNKNIIRLNEVITNFALKNFLYKNFTIDNLKISSKETKIQDILKIYGSIKNSPELFILRQVIKNGYLAADINLNFDEEGQVREDYQIKGYVKEGRLSLLNKKFINDLNFNFEANYKNYLLNNLSLDYNKLKFLSKSIKLEDKKKYFLIKGNLKNNKTEIDPQILSLFFNSGIQNLSNMNINSKNNFQFKIDKKFKIKDLVIESDISLNKANYKLNLPKLKEYLPKFNNLIKFEGHKINLIYKKNKFIIKGKGNFLFKDNKEIIEYKIEKLNDNFIFKSLITLNNNPIIINFLDYKKKR